MSHKKNKKQLLVVLFFLMVVFGCLTIIILISWGLIQNTDSYYGSPDPSLGALKRLELGYKLINVQDELLTPTGKIETQEYFIISPSESVQMIALRLEESGWIWNSTSFINYLIYKGYDRAIHSGEFSFTPEMNPIQIAERLRIFAGNITTFTILPGWRMEEVAAATEFYQFGFTPEEFQDVVLHPGNFPEITGSYRSYPSLEGMLSPGEYKVDQGLSLDIFLNMAMARFEDSISPAMRRKYEKNGLTLYQAIVLASIIEKEAMLSEEAPTIASVFYNRLSAGMKLESDPTVQYAIGYEIDQKTWWKNPLTRDDLIINSVYNTYHVNGLPPSPICNPGLAALKAVANPSITDYYFFRAACDGSGRHDFSVTFEEHRNKSCD
ncbi:MAG: endolytic transglycosylase MltG [Anaerolinea sp.]|nr:endolytic transglycosylase MltG [Anaerolinea sp.]